MHWYEPMFVFWGFCFIFLFFNCPLPSYCVSIVMLFFVVTCRHIFIRENKHAFTLYNIRPHWMVTGNWHPSWEVNNFSIPPSHCHSCWRALIPWWRHQMEAFSALLALCVGNSPVTGEFPTQRPVTRSFDVFLGLRLNKRLSKQSCGRWFDTPSHLLWRHCNVNIDVILLGNVIR